jgi:glutaconate CoA-transferase subunit B
VPYPEISVITDLCVMEIDRATGTLGVARLAPGVTFDTVQQNTGFDLHRPADVPEISPPSGDIVELLRREVDPGGVYLNG